MKGLKTVAANLAGRINQQHYLEVELAKVYNTGFKQGRGIAPLVYEWCERGFTWSCEAAGFRYSCIACDNGMWACDIEYLATKEIQVHKYNITLEEAKAYCQKHHEEQLLKFLLPAQTPPTHE